MEQTSQTMQQLGRMLRKIAEKFPEGDEATLLTDIHLRVNQDTGELVAFDDDDREITRSVVEQWIDSKDDEFFEAVAVALRRQIDTMHDVLGSLSILKPYAFVLEDDDREPLSELYVADDDTVIIDPDLMEGLDEDLDDFFDKLMKS